MKRSILTLVIVYLTISFSSAQTIKVNPDGTHSIIFNHGATSTVVNPDGTHSTVFHHGKTSTQVNPDGTHSTIFHNGATSTIVNPDGTHSVVINNGETSTQINPDGTHSIIKNDSSTSIHQIKQNLQVNTLDNKTSSAQKNPNQLKKKNNYGAFVAYSTIPFLILILLLSN